MKKETAPKIVGPDREEAIGINRGEKSWEEGILSFVSSKKFKIGVPLIGGTGLALGGGDVIGEVTKSVPGVHRSVDWALAGFGADKASADHGGSHYIPAENTPIVPPPVATLPGLSPAEIRPHATATPPRPPEPTATPPRPPEMGALKVMKVHDKDAGGDVDFGEEGLPWGFSVDGPGANDFRMQTNAAVNPESGAVVAAVTPGQYTVCEDEKPGWFETTAQKCKTVIVSALQIAHVPFFNKQVEATPVPPTATSTSKPPEQPQPTATPKVKFVPPTPTPVTFTCPDGRVITLPEPFQGGRATAKEVDLKGEVACTEAITFELLPKIKDDTGFIREGIGVPDKDNDGHPDDTLYAQADRNKETIVANDDENTNKIVDAINDIKDGRDWLLYGLGAAGVGTLGFGLWRGFRAIGRRLDRIRTDILGHVHGGNGQAQFPQQPDGVQPQGPQGAEAGQTPAGQTRQGRRIWVIPIPFTRRRETAEKPQQEAKQESGVVDGEYREIHDGEGVKSAQAQPSAAREGATGEAPVRRLTEEERLVFAEVLRPLIERIRNMSDEELKPIAEEMPEEHRNKARDVLLKMGTIPEHMKDFEFAPLAILRMLIKAYDELSDEEKVLIERMAANHETRS